MSMFEDGSYGSLTGIALIGKVLAGRCPMHYTRAAVGSGLIPDGQTPKTMRDCAGYVMDALIANVSNPVDGECQVTIQIKSDFVQTGFYATNIVLFAEDPDEGEVPYTYLSLENEPEWIRPASSIVGKIATFDLIAAVGDVDTVTAVIDPEAIATVGHVAEMIAAHNADPNAHGGGTGGGAQVYETALVLPDVGWTPNTDPDDEEGWLHIDVPVLNVTENQIPLFAVLPTSRAAAKECGLSNELRTMDGIVRVYALQQPTAEIAGRLALLGISGTTVPGGTAELGAGLTSANGRVSVNFATGADVKEMFETKD